MNRIWQQLAIATNWPILLAVTVLSTIGIASIWVESPPDGQKQLIFIFVGLAGMAAFQAFDYRHIGRFAWGFYIASMLLLLYTVLPGIPRSGLFGVPSINGAHAWINFKILMLEPSELVKIAFVLVLARYLRFRSNYRTFAGLLAPFAIAGAPLLLIMKQPDLGTALIFIPALFAMLFVAGAKVKHLLVIVGAGLVLAPVMWLAGPAPEGPGIAIFKYLPVMVKPYQRARVYGMFSHDPRTLRTTGFQVHWALIAFASGGADGKGLGDIPVSQRVPEVHNDMIFAMIGEQFGFIGAAIVLGAYIVLFSAGVEISAATREPFGRLVALGIVAVLAGQTFLNLLVMLGLFPVTGITLPFISYGGSSLLASFLAIGLLLNVGQNRPLVMARNSFEFQ